MRLRSRASARERSIRFRNHDCGASLLSTCSILNFSAHAITGRQITWSSTTITAIMVAMPQRMLGVSPALAAVWRYEPSPGRRKSFEPSTNISQAIRKNQPPATDIIEFHTSPMAA